MPCYRPMRAYYSKFLNSTGLRSLVFNARDALQPDDPLDIPCGQCIGCRLKRSAMWAGRIVAESQMHDESCFITLTYSDEYLPDSGSLDLRDFQLFMKRFRKKFGSGIRFFHCGEYGDNFRRPHYHACIFGVTLNDKELYKIHNGEKYFISKTLEELWGKGFCVIGDVTFESAAYVARYCTKKINGPLAFDHYNVFDRDTGEIFTELKPEYCTMSRRPGIGFEWFQKFGSDIFPWDEYIVDSRSVPIPKYFDNLLKKSNPFLFDDISERRVVRAKKNSKNYTSDRLLTRERYRILMVDKLHREYEFNGTQLCV